MDGAHDFFLFVPFFQALLIQVQGLDVPVLSYLVPHIGHAQLLALVDIGRPLHPVKKDGQHLRRLHPVFPIVPPAGDNPGQIVVVPEQAVPALPVELRLPAAEDFLQLQERQGRQIPLLLPRHLIQADMLKLEHHIELMGVISRIKAGL